MCLIPGVEITQNSFSHRNSSHIVILGIDAYIDPDQSIEEICRRARIQNALSVVAHPVSTQKIEAQTRFLWDNRERLQPILDVWEVASGDIIFKEVLESGLSIIANSDLHHPRQMSSWKTKVYGPMSEKHILDEIKHQNLEIFFYEYNFGQEFLENVHLQKRSYVEGSVFQH